MYFEIDFRKLAICILIVALTILGFNYYEQKHPQPARTPIATFYAMGSDKGPNGASRWWVNLYGVDKTDFDELFKHVPLTALTNQANYNEVPAVKDTDPYIEIYRTNNQSKDWWNDDFLHTNKTVVLRRWCKDLPYGGEALAKFIAEQVELSGLLPPPQS